MADVRRSGEVSGRGRATRRLAVVGMLLVLGAAVEPPNPACLVPVPFHCDPKPEDPGS